MKAVCNRHGAAYEVNTGCLDCNALEAEAKPAPLGLPPGHIIGIGSGPEGGFFLMKNEDGSTTKVARAPANPYSNMGPVPWVQFHYVMVPVNAAAKIRK